jgi:oxygen-dependent protoporphyrinogen oxidase
VKLNSPVTKLSQIGDGWRVTTAAGEAEHRAVIYCGTAYRLAELQIAARQPVSFSTLAEVRYPPVASVVLGFRREDVAHSCNGFGMLIPGVEGFNILGTIFSSALFPNRAPAGHITLTSYVGGERQPELASKPPEELFALVQEDLSVLLGVRGRPTFAHSVFWPKAIPQYNVGYGKFKDLMNDAEAKAPGLFLAGHFRDGVSLSDSIVSGVNVAERVEKAVNLGHPSRA